MQCGQYIDMARYERSEFVFRDTPLFVDVVQHQLLEHLHKLRGCTGDETRLHRHPALNTHITVAGTLLRNSVVRVVGIQDAAVCLCNLLRRADTANKKTRLSSPL